jgi:hypothetical protein
VIALIGLELCFEEGLSYVTTQKVAVDRAQVGGVGGWDTRQLSPDPGTLEQIREIYSKIVPLFN